MLCTLIVIRFSQFVLIFDIQVYVEPNMQFAMYVLIQHKRVAFRSAKNL